MSGNWMAKSSTIAGWSYGIHVMNILLQKNIEMFICNDNTIGIRLSDMSGNWMAKSCLIAEWSIIQVTIWLQDKKSGNWMVVLS